MTSVFAKYQEKNYPYRYNASLFVNRIVGGIPSDPKVAEGWLRTKIAEGDDLIREAIATLMMERDIDSDAAVEQLIDTKHLTGFKRDENGLYIEGRQVKACIKEAASVAANEGRINIKGWVGPGVDKSYAKHIKGWLPEHVFVIEDRVYLGVSERTGVQQGFVHGRHGSSIKYEEYVDEAKLTFTVETDHKFKDEEWAALWLTAERQGIGAGRSQGYGRFTVVDWTKA